MAEFGAVLLEYRIALFQRLPELKPAYAEHLLANDVLLPLVFFGDIARFIIGVTNGDTISAPGVRLLEYLETAMNEGSGEIAELIVVSFVENLCGEKELSVIKGYMGPTLKQWANSLRK